MIENQRPGESPSKSTSPRDPCHSSSGPLNAEEIQSHLAGLKQWELSPDGKKILRHLRMKDFSSAIGFFCRVAELAERLDHHPDLHLENYRHVRVELSTHSVGGLTRQDFLLAGEIEGLVREWETG